jgi:O-antigen/teichoic acid export membrane protein
MDVITKKSNDNTFRMKITRTIFFFILSKGVAFLAPLILIGYVSLLEYGKIEYSYGLGRLLCGCALLGIGGAYPYFMLKKQETDKEMYFYLYGFIGFLVSALFLILKISNIFEDEILFTYLFTFVFAFQGLYSGILKTEDKGYKGVMFDSGYYFLLAVILSFRAIVPSLPVAKVLMWGLWINILGYSVYFTYRFFVVKRIKGHIYSWIKVAEIVKFGIPLVLSGFIMYWLTSCARVYIGHFIGYEAVGIYSFYFRLVGISVVIQQFLYIAFFKKLYMGDSSFLDKYYVLVMVLILACCIVVSLLSIPIVGYFMPDKDFSDIKLLLLLSIQMPIWVGISFCEGLTARENIVIKMNIRLVFIVLAFALFLFLIRNHLDLHIFTLGMIIQFYMAFTIQIMLLRKRGVGLRKCMVVNTFFFLMGVVVYLI